jgi:hypothetical protein
MRGQPWTSGRHMIRIFLTGLASEVFPQMPRRRGPGTRWHNRWGRQKRPDCLKAWSAANVDPVREAARVNGWAVREDKGPCAPRSYGRCSSLRFTRDTIAPIYDGAECVEYQRLDVGHRQTTSTLRERAATRPANFTNRPRRACGGRLWVSSLRTGGASNLIGDGVASASCAAPPELTQTVLSASSPRTTWCVLKQVRISLVAAVLGSYTARPRFAPKDGSIPACRSPDLANLGGEPDIALLVHHQSMRAGPAVPDCLTAPIGRRRHGRALRGLHVGFTHRHVDRGRPILLRIEHRDVFAAFFRGAKMLAIGIDGRAASVASRTIAATCSQNCAAIVSGEIC